MGKQNRNQKQKRKQKPKVALSSGGGGGKGDDLSGILRWKMYVSSFTGAVSASAATALPSTSEESVEGSCLSDMIRQLQFSSGNPRIEETRGVLHLFRDDLTSSASGLPVDRNPTLCVLNVPNHMTYADFCQFCGAFIQHMLEMRIVRNDEVEVKDRYSVLIRFDNQGSTDSFYKHFNGKRFSSLEAEVCHVLFIVVVQYTGSIEHTQASVVNSTEQPTCPVCLEKLDPDTEGILTTICNHSFHCSCISKWTDSSCPVCRYCQQQPEKSICFICQTSENLWMCVICGFVGCGRYKEGHAIMHWKDTEHCYSLEVETQRVWDYAGDNYVHRLIQSKTDGKLVELNAHCQHVDSGCDSCDCSGDSAVKEAILNSKVEVIVNEYNELLSTQLENQKLYFESLLQEVKDETDREISEAIEKATSLKLQKLQAKVDKCAEEKKFLDEINENLLKNQQIWETKIQEAEERQRMTVQRTDENILVLKEELARLMAAVEAKELMEKPSVSDEHEPKDEALLSSQGDEHEPKDEALLSSQGDEHEPKDEALLSSQGDEYEPKDEALLSSQGESSSGKKSKGSKKGKNRKHR